MLASNIKWQTVNDRLAEGGLFTTLNVRERYINDNSFNSLSDYDVLKLLFSYCRIPQKNADSLAINMLDEFGTFANLAEAHPEEIKSRCNVSEYTSVLISMIPKLANLYLTNKWDKKVRLTTSTIAGKCKYIADSSSSPALCAGERRSGSSYVC